MKRLRIILCAAATTVAALSAFSQHHGTGLVWNDEAVARIPVKPRLLTRDYTAIPRAVSLLPYCPTPGDQESYGTCVGWASTYGARTIMEAIDNGWTNRATITNETFAPLFIYHQIRFNKNDNCQNGTNIEMALEELVDNGAPKYRDFKYKCVNSIPSPIFTKAKPYAIDDYFNLFSIYDTPQQKITATKKAIAEKRPVVIGMNVPASFMTIGKSPVWNKTEKNNDGGGHAMVVIGYDDNKYGGAFQILNSWGPNWAENGTVWVRYADYGANTKYGFEFYLKPKPVPVKKTEPAPVKKTEPAPVKKTDPVPVKNEGKNKFAGSLRLQLSTGETMQPQLANGIYTMKGSYLSGTRYRVYLTNNEPAYVYVIASDKTKSVARVFPPDDLTSPALVYKSNNIALPNEQWFIEMDDTTGTDNLCVLYSQNALDISTLMSQIERGSGTFAQRVRSALGSRAVTNAAFTPTAISFTAQSDATVVPVFVDITHI